MSRTAGTRYSCPDHPFDHDRSCCPDLGIHTPLRAKGSKSIWNYTHRFNRDDQVQIHSKRQFNRECAKRGLTHVVRDDLLSNGQAWKNKSEPMDKKLIEQTAKDIVPKVKQKLANGEFNQ